MSMGAAARIKEKLDIVEYIGRSVTLKKAGRNYSGLCPFHSENSPSFNVSPDRGIFKCFGCGVSGDLFNFVMQRDGLSFNEALKVLAQEAGVELEQESGKRKAERSLEERYLEMHELATEYYHFLLVKHEVGKEAREYLEKRGLVLDESEKRKAGSIIEEFKIGYAPKSWDALGSFLLNKGYKAEEIIGCGLGVKSDKSKRGFYDMFRGRVMFPLFDKSGRVVGFAGRVLGSEKTAKYINTAETPIFHKREFLFGYAQAKETIRRKGEAVLVEGEMDMLSSYKVGVKNVVAVKGSALTEEQVELLGRVCNRLLLCFDADFAGDKAMRKAIELAENKGMEIKVIQLKLGKDPDECIKKGVQLWLDSIASAVPYYDFLIQSALKRYDVKDAFGKRNVLSELIPYFSTIKDVIVRGHYTQRLSTLLDMSEQSLEKLMRGTDIQAQWSSRQVFKPVQTASPRPAVRKDNDTLHLEQVRRNERYFMALLLHMKVPVLELEKKLQLEDMDDKNVREVYNLYIDFFANHPDSYIDDFLQFTASKEVLPVIDEIFLIDVPFENDNELSKELFVTLKQLKELVLRERIRLLSLEIKKAEISGENADIAGLQKEIFSLHERLGRLQRMDN